MWQIFQLGGWVMFPLLICSVIAFAIVIERTVFWRNIYRHQNIGLTLKILDLADQGKFEAARELGQPAQDGIIKILLSGIAHRDYSLTSAIEMAAFDELKRLQKYIPVLETIITIAPLLGILGTILGIIQAFDLLGVGLGQLAGPKQVMAGIAKSLLTTAWGLIIAIPTLIMTNWFQSQTGHYAREIEKFGTSLEICYQKHYSKR